MSVDKKTFYSQMEQIALTCQKSLDYPNPCGFFPSYFCVTTEGLRYTDIEIFWVTPEGVPF